MKKTKNLPNSLGVLSSPPLRWNKDVKTVKVWNIQWRGKNIRVATIEHTERHPSPCEGCFAPCCKGSLLPVLSAEEFLKRKFKTKFIPTPEYIKKQVPRADYLAVLAVDPIEGCPYLDKKTNKCTVWNDPPKACLYYDCRQDPRAKKLKWGSHSFKKK